MPKKIDLSTWNRRKHFEFFSQFEEPFFGITASVNATQAYRHAKKTGASFYLTYLHCILAAVNDVEAMRLRIADNNVILHDRIDVSATVNRLDNTFGFSYIEFHPDFDRFCINAREEMERVRNSTELFPVRNSDQVIHFSALPWIDFTSLSHARPFSRPDSSPKLSVGKLVKDGELQKMPLSIHVHHGLADGYHVGLFYEKVQELMDGLTP